MAKRIGIVLTVVGGLACLYLTACLVVPDTVLKQISRICPDMQPPPCAEFPTRD